MTTEANLIEQVRRELEAAYRRGRKHAAREIGCALRPGVGVLYCSPAEPDHPEAWCAACRILAEEP